MRAFCLFVASAGGLGYAPWAPGSVGSLAAVALHYFGLAHLPVWLWGLIVLLTIPTACLFAHQAGRYLGEADSGIIVIDEVAGYFVASFLAPAHWFYVLSAYGCFRTLDVVKPWPASYFDQKVKNGFGVVMDDIAAGAYALAITQLVGWLCVEVIGEGVI